MRIRPATIADIDQCERLDGTYMTDYVWHMEQVVGEGHVGVSFRQTRLPRPVQVSYPGDASELYPDWQRGQCFVVAEELGRIYGYLDLIADSYPWQGWIRHLVVHPDHRRRGIGTHLFQVAEQWAQQSELRSIMASVQTKNHPAISLLRKRGYVFQGFIDRLYRTGDVALLYTLEL